MTNSLLRSPCHSTLWVVLEEIRLSVTAQHDWTMNSEPLNSVTFCTLPMDNLKKVLVEEAPIIPQPSPLHPVLQAGTQASILAYMQDSVGVSDILRSVLISN